MKFTWLQIVVLALLYIGFHVFLSSMVLLYHMQIPSNMSTIDILQTAVLIIFIGYYLIKKIDDWYDKKSLKNKNQHEN